MNSAQFKGQLLILAELTNKDLSSGVTAQYFWETFGHLPDDVLAPAFAMAKRTSRYFPSVPDFETLVRQVARGQGQIVDGVSAWEACERLIFRCWSEANDHLVRQEGGYPWPDAQCKSIVRDELNLTVRRIALLHPKEYERVREEFIRRYNGAAALVEAQAAVLAAGDMLRLGRGE